MTSLLNITLSHNWLLPTITTMRLWASVVQALPLSDSRTLKLTQVPGFTKADVDSIMADADEPSLPVFLKELRKREDARAEEAQKVAEKWGKLEVVDVSFRVLGERIVTPSAMVHLVAKLRINPPTNSPTETSSKDETIHDEKDEEFLTGKNDTEETKNYDTPGWAHAPRWPVVSLRDTSSHS